MHAHLTSFTVTVRLGKSGWKFDIKSRFIALPILTMDLVILLFLKISCAVSVLSIYPYVRCKLFTLSTSPEQLDQFL